MTKKVIQDVVPPGEKKGIRNIPVPDRTLRSRFVSRVKADHSNEDEAEEETSDDNFEHGRKAPNERVSKSKAPLVLSLVIILLVIAFFVANMFGSTTVKIVRHSVIGNYSNELIVIDYGGENSVAKPLSIDITASEKVQATEEETIKTKASGKIIIYNDFSSDSQKLIKNTRFEASNKKIYRINDSVVVPGQKKVNGKNVPGSLEVTVYADAEGEEFNIEMSDLTIPGFKGTSRYNAIYARTKTAISGGFNGTIKKVSSEIGASAKLKMQKQIEEKMTNEINSSIPENYIFFLPLAKITYSELPQTEVTADSVTLNLRAKIDVPVFSKEALARTLAKKYVDLELSKDNPFVFDVNTLEYSTPSVEESSGKKTLSFKTNGSVRIMWPVDEVLLKAKIAGSKRNDIADIFSEHKTISKAKAYVKPFWKSSFNSDVKEIKIEFVDEL